MLSPRLAAPFDFIVLSFDPFNEAFSMKFISAFSVALLIGLPTVSLAQSEPENCMSSAISIIISNDRENHTEYTTCLAACEADASCVAWNFSPHSFDAERTGWCQLLGDVYQTEPSDRGVCGRIER